ncbi:MAG: type II toxin-antitoxin system RelE/ParE family toxin [Gemmataceae bacterium]|nr:type II toxin-antitoxin system RelE/ParE family toxin [Gemmataceae bacterium]
MSQHFVEASGFTEWVTEHLADADYAHFQRVLTNNPNVGAVMKKCGGLRKIRVRDPKRGKGKRSGARVVYLHVPEARRFYMIDGYGKDEKDDLSEAEKKVLATLAAQLRAEAILAAANEGKKR